MSTATESKKWFHAHSPELGPKFAQFYQACNEKSSLDDKTRELLMLALACAFRCPHCTEQHIKKALDVGVSKEQISDALLIAAVEGAGTQLMWQNDLFEKYLGS